MESETSSFVFKENRSEEADLDTHGEDYEDFHDEDFLQADPENNLAEQ
jgi:hypothetical protein